jgi:hypothetical protein
MDSMVSYKSAGEPAQFSRRRARFIVQENTASFPTWQSSHIWETQEFFPTQAIFYSFGRGTGLQAASASLFVVSYL